MSISAQNPDISGERQSGQDVRTQNVMACQAVSNIVKTSLGPVGLDKMLVDDIGDVTITNDGATILRMLEVEHPAAKVLVELAELQDREVGDGTTSVVIVAAELLKRANDLVRNKIHPTSIISGYRLAMREACKYIEEKLVTKVEKLGKVPLINCAKTSMSSKLISGDSDFFANLVVDAVLLVKMTNQRGEIKYPIKGINILKAHGQSARDSYLLNGYALNTGRAAQGMPLRVSPAKIACLDFNLQKTKMQLGVQVVVNDPRELEKIRQREADMTKERIEKLLKAGANVILTTKGIDDMALKYFVEAGAIAVRRVRKEDMRHVAKATGATLVTTFADMEGEETFDPAHLGTAEEVVEERIADDDVVLIKGTKTSSAVSLILRGANDYMLDEMERALHDALCIVKRTLESNTVVAGGGAVESALSVYLEHLATTLGSREQLAIAEFADALLIIPKVLAVNAAKDATELVAKLRAYHHTAQTKADKKHYSSMGLDLVNGTIRNNLEAGVIEPAMSKVKIIQFATEAAITILRIDDMIKLVKEDGQGDERIQQRFPDTRDGLATNGLSISEQLGEQKSPETPKSPLPCTDFDAAYSHSYAHVRIHEEMIKGIFFFVYPLVWLWWMLAVVEQASFQSSLLKPVLNGDELRVDTVLSLKIGVYAVDASDIAVQDVEIEEEADVIVSEWMGYMLLSRDRWLKPGGLILPSHATLYMAPISHPDRYSHSIGFWRNVYGIDMMQLAKQCAFEEPSVESISGENVLTWPEVVFPCYMQSL
ncbi:hypothetical protein IGI04_003270 [Brassica rapa subsp. trilocularis]|uniref:T-complex protein 1 subunit alpha n=1 Tax=Brassica rapa subsp. trilocularis TaxID=1813537 RepID=A0ABQ7NXY5_BRACM|nr:hypothetical protein IGI04_003270 [Brassica rapa subsp. trilocularis]